MRARIRGKLWDIRFVPKIEGGVHGLCDGPTVPHKQIQILDSLRGERRLAIVIHELLHAAYWDLDEEAIEETATDLARILLRLGYSQENF